MHLPSVLPLVSYLSILYLLPVRATAKCCYPAGADAGPCFDGTKSTPCCGWGKCRIACCYCKGVREARINVIITLDGTEFIDTSVLKAPKGTTWTCRDNMSRWMSDPENLSDPSVQPLGKRTVMADVDATMVTVESQTADAKTAQSGNADATATATATLAAETAFKRDGSAYLVAAALGPTLTPVSDFTDEQNELSQCDKIFEEMSRGTDRIDLEGYLAYFGAPLFVADLQGNPAEEVERIEGWRDMLIKHYGMRDADGDGFLSREEADALV